MSNVTTSEPADEDYEYVTSVEGNMAILREIAKLRFKERLPLIMARVAEELVAAGVDFSRADFSRVTPISEDEWDAIYEDLR